MRKGLVFITVLIFYAAQCVPVSAQGSPPQPPVGRYQLVSVSAGQQAGVFLLDTATGCTWQLGRNQETNRLTFVEMDVENLHWSWGSGAQQAASTLRMDAQGSKIAILRPRFSIFTVLLHRPDFINLTNSIC